jgi:hypothetical protein
MPVHDTGASQCGPEPESAYPLSKREPRRKWLLEIDEPLHGRWLDDIVSKRGGLLQSRIPAAGGRTNSRDPGRPHVPGDLVVLRRYEAKRIQVDDVVVDKAKATITDMQEVSYDEQNKVRTCVAKYISGPELSVEETALIHNVLTPIGSVDHSYDEEMRQSATKTCKVGQGQDQVMYWIKPHLLQWRCM